MVPESASEITRDWLTASLRAAAALSQDASVAEFQLERAGPGLAGKVYRMRLQYDPDGSGPETVIAKFADPESPVLRRYPQKLATEASFYKELGGDCGVAVPHCYFVARDTQRGLFCLLMEDVGASGTPGRVVPRDDWQLVLREIAGMHARWWQSSDLTKHPWLMSFEEDCVSKRAALVGAIAPFVQRWKGQLSPEMMRIFERLPELFDAACLHLSLAPRTLVHTDINPGNVVIREENGRRNLRILDWQDVIIGPAARDLMIPLNTMAPAERDGAPEFYCTELLGRGVDYPSERLSEDLVAGAVFSAGVALIRGSLGTEDGDTAFRRFVTMAGESWAAAYARFG